MGININFQGQSSPAIRQNYDLSQKHLQKSVFNSPFDRTHKNTNNLNFSMKNDGIVQKEIPKDGIFQIEDITEIDEFCKFKPEELGPLNQYEGQPWSKKIFNETAAYFLNNIEKLKMDKNQESFADGVTVAALLDKLCYRGVVLTSENREKIMQVSEEYGWQLPKSFRDCLNEEQCLYFDFLADDFERDGMEKYAPEVKKITEEGEVIYLKE